jgi:hypothetical protein
MTPNDWNDVKSAYDRYWSAHGVQAMIDKYTSEDWQDVLPEIYWA